MTEISIKDGPIVKKKVVRLRFLCLTYNYRAGAVIRNLRVLSWPLFRTSIQFVVANSLSYFGVFSEIQTVKKAYFVS